MSAWARGAPTSLTVYVYCRRVSKPISEVSASVALGPQVNSTNTASAACPGKRRLVSGGFSAETGGLGAQSALPYASIRAGNTWSYSAFNLTQQARMITVHAYCAKGVDASFVEAATGAPVLPNGSIASTSPPCGGKKRLSGGGFSVSSARSSDFFPVITESRINGGAWLATVTRVGGPPHAPTAVVTSQAVCTR